MYDGDCGFCTSTARFLRRTVPGPYHIVAWQEADLGELGLSKESCERAVQWVGPAGEHYEGAAAFSALLATSDRLPVRAFGRWLQGPFVSRVAAGTYSIVAANRSRLPGATPACRLPPDRRPR